MRIQTRVHSQLKSPLLIVASCIVAICFCDRSFAQELTLGAGENVKPQAIATIENAKLVLINNVSISARDSGVVTELNVAEGDSVVLGDVIVELDRELHEAQLATAVQRRLKACIECQNDIDVRFAEKSAAVNAQVLSRSQRAADTYAKSVSKTEVERLRLELERSKLSKEQAQHANEVARVDYELSSAEERISQLQLKNREIDSPLSGQVAEVLVQLGEYVSPGQPIARVINLNRLKVEAYVDSDDAIQLSKGQAAEISAMAGGERITARGKVVFVSAEVDPLNSDVRVMIEIDNSDRKFRPGMLGDVQIMK